MRTSRGTGGLAAYYLNASRLASRDERAGDILSARLGCCAAASCQHGGSGERGAAGNRAGDAAVQLCRA
jgi:hypothetical protein